MKGILGFSSMNLILIVLVIAVAFFLLNNNTNVAEGFADNTGAIIGGVLGVTALLFFGLLWLATRR